jgi:hypothetical protein
VKVDLTEFLVKKDEVIVTKTISTSTDNFKNRPVSPPYIQHKTGVDASTQIEENDKIFIFDREVAPIVDVLMVRALRF